MYRGDARRVVEICDELIACRPRIHDKEDFARLVIQNLFGEGTADLLLLRPKFDDDLQAEALNRMIGLVGFESSVFKIIYTNDELFSDFIRLFCEHAIRSSATEFDAAESIYMWLLMEYLEHLLPKDETKLNFMKNSPMFSAPSSSSPTSGVTSPRKLLRPEVLARSYPPEYMAMRSSSIRSLYPRIIQFVGNLIKHLSSMSTWPSMAQLEMLKVVVDHYHEFILSDTVDPDFASLKMTLAQKPLFINPLQVFLERLLTNWPLESNYLRLMELWMALTYHHSLDKCSEEKLKVFMQASTQFFVGLFEVVVLRVFETDCLTLFTSGTMVLEFLERNIFSDPHLLRMFNTYDLPTSEFLELILSKLTKFQGEQRLFTGIEKDANAGFLAKIAQFFAGLSEMPKVSPEMVEKHIRELSRLLCNINQADSLSQSSFGATSSKYLSRMSAEYSVNEGKNVSLLKPGDSRPSSRSVDQNALPVFNL